MPVKNPSLAADKKGMTYVPFCNIPSVLESSRVGKPIVSTTVSGRNMARGETIAQTKLGIALYSVREFVSVLVSLLC